MAKKARMSGPMSNAVRDRAVGLKPYAEQPIRVGGVGPKVWHGVASQRWGIPLPPSVKGPRPSDAARRAKGIPSKPAGKKIEPFQIADRPERHRV
jgi:hypothetical protein